MSCSVDRGQQRLRPPGLARPASSLGERVPSSRRNRRARAGRPRSARRGSRTCRRRGRRRRARSRRSASTYVMRRIVPLDQHARRPAEGRVGGEVELLSASTSRGVREARGQLLEHDAWPRAARATRRGRSGSRVRTRGGRGRSSRCRSSRPAARRTWRASRLAEPSSSRTLAPSGRSTSRDLRRRFSLRFHANTGGDEPQQLLDGGRDQRRARRRSRPSASRSAQAARAARRPSRLDVVS